MLTYEPVRVSAMWGLAALICGLLIYLVLSKR